jgi:hypothetical protein
MHHALFDERMIDSYEFIYLFHTLQRSFSDISNICPNIPNCAANGFVEMELGRVSERRKCTRQILQYWYQIMCLDTEDPIKCWYEWAKSNMSVRS